MAKSVNKTKPKIIKRLKVVSVFVASLLAARGYITPRSYTSSNSKCYSGL